MHSVELWVQSSTQNYKLTEKIAIQTASVRDFSFNTGRFPCVGDYNKRSEGLSLFSLQQAYLSVSWRKGAVRGPDVTAPPTCGPLGKAHFLAICA